MCFIFQECNLGIIVLHAKLSGLFPVLYKRKTMPNVTYTIEGLRYFFKGANTIIDFRTNRKIGITLG